MPGLGCVSMSVVHNLFWPRVTSRLLKFFGGQTTATTKPMSDECIPKTLQSNRIELLLLLLLSKLKKAMISIHRIILVKIPDTWQPWSLVIWCNAFRDNTLLDFNKINVSSINVDSHSVWRTMYLCTQTCLEAPLEAQQKQHTESIGKSWKWQRNYWVTNPNITLCIDALVFVDLPWLWMLIKFHGPLAVGTISVFDMHFQAKIIQMLRN